MYFAALDWLRLWQIPNRFNSCKSAAGRQGDKPVLNPRQEKMKIRSLFTLAGLAFGFALPSFAQQTNTPAPGATEKK